MPAARAAGLRALAHGAAALLLGLVFLHHISGVPFHADEGARIRSSNVFEAYFSGDLHSAVWDDGYYNRTQPQLSRYLVGLGRRLGGYGLADLPDRDRAQPDMLWWCRLPMAVLAVLTGLLLFRLLWIAAGAAPAAVFLVFFTLNPFFALHLRRAMGEASLLFFWAAAMVAAEMAWRRSCEHAQRGASATWQAALLFAASAVCVALSASAKLNGFSVLPALWAVLWLVLGARPAWRLLVSWGATGAASLAVFVVLNPYLYPAPVMRLKAMWDHRISEMQVQAERVPRLAIRPGERASVLAAEVFEKQALVRRPIAEMPAATLAVLGLLLLLGQASRDRSSAPARAAAVVLLFGAFAALPTMWTPLDWSRYYLFPVTFTSMLMAVALGRAISRVFASVSRATATQSA